MKTKKHNRRTFVKSSLLTTAAIGTFAVSSSAQQAVKTDPEPTPLSELNLVGPKEGYTPHMGALVSMLNWMRDVVLGSVRNLSTEQLDYLHDDDSNSIGAMLLHLGATERFYQLNTFEGRRWGNWPSEDRKLWSVAMSLGGAGRREIKGQPIDYYLERLSKVREHTLAELKKRDDAWLMEIDPKWGWGSSTNNYCKWFHVCEHESNHNGQIKYIRSRISV